MEGPPASELNGAAAAQGANYSMPGIRSAASFRSSPAQWAGVITGLAGLTALSGWMFHVGSALAAKPFKRLKRLSQLAAAAAVLVGATSLVGYLWNANELVTNSWLPPGAINTVVMLGLGIRCRKRRFRRVIVRLSKAN